VHPPPPVRLRVLLLSGDPLRSEAARRALDAAAVPVDRVDGGRRGLAEALKGRHDVVVVDAAVAELSAVEVCRALRAWSAIPVLALCGAGDEGDRVRALEAGADACLAPPFSSRELLAHLRALVRRARGAVGPPRELIRLGELEISVRDRRATLGGRPLGLTTAEFVTLRVLAERAGRVLTREELLELTKGSADEAFDRSIDVQISRLRGPGTRNRMRTGAAVG